MNTARRSWLGCRCAASVAVLGGAAQHVRAEDTIKVGILHSLSGTMAISETILKDLMLMQIAEIRTPRAACSARRSSRWWSIPPRTGRCSPRRRAS